MLGVFRLIIYDAVVNLVVILAKVRRETHNKLVKQSSNAINVRSSVVSLAH
jgi:hypothetical protein